MNNRYQDLIRRVSAALILLSFTLVEPREAFAGDLPNQLSEQERFEKGLEAMNRLRSYYRDAISLDKVLPIVEKSFARLKREYSYLAEEPLHIHLAELLFSYDQRCSSDSFADKLKSRPYWYIEMGRRVFGDGGGVCLFIDAITGEELTYRLTE